MNPSQRVDPRVSQQRRGPWVAPCSAGGTARVPGRPGRAERGLCAEGRPGRTLHPSPARTFPRPGRRQLRTAPAVSLSPVPAHIPRARRRRHRVRTDTPVPRPPRPVPPERPARASAAAAGEAPLPPSGRHQLRQVPALTRFEGRPGGRERE